MAVPALVPSVLPEVGAHALEVASTLLEVGSFLVIFVAARLLAEGLVRLQLPTILGELVAGVLIGTSGLRLIVPPEAHGQVNEGLLRLIGQLADVPIDRVAVLYGDSQETLHAVATLGLFALLFLTGLESELDELVAVGAQAASVALAGVVLPFAAGTVGLIVPFQVDLIPAVFAGASLTATSIGITASVFSELSMLRTREGQIVLGAAVLDDILGIVILAVVVSLAGGGHLSVGPIATLVLAAVLFVLAALGLSRTAAPLFDGLLDRLHRRRRERARRVVDLRLGNQVAHGDRQSSRYTPHNALHQLVASTIVHLQLKVAARAQRHQVHKLARQHAARHTQPLPMRHRVVHWRTDTDHSSQKR